MTQTYQMKHNPQGTIYSLLTVESDGRMTMTFHGTDREICHEVTENVNGWLCYPGAMFPGLESGKWNKMDDGRGLTADVVETMETTETTNFTNYTNNHAEQAIVEEATTFAIKREQGDTCINHAEREQSQDCESSVNFTNDTNNKPRPRRQRKPRKSRVERQPSAISHQPSDTMKAIGMVVAMTVALFVIYETGLLIPLGLIGLATGGILK